MHSVEFGDLLGFVNAIEAELARFEASSQAVIEERCQASLQIQERYSLKNERQRSLLVWSQLLSSV
jgi:hypothetical protein